MSPIKRMTIKKPPRKKKTPVQPCRRCYYPLDEHGWCLACERRAEAEAANG
jgi:hypothetical protein